MDIREGTWTVIFALPVAATHTDSLQTTCKFVPHQGIVVELRYSVDQGLVGRLFPSHRARVASADVSASFHSPGQGVSLRRCCVSRLRTQPASGSLMQELRCQTYAIPTSQRIGENKRVSKIRSCQASADPRGFVIVVAEIVDAV